MVGSGGDDADQPPPRLTTLPENPALTKACGVDRAYVCHFNRKLAALAADDFIERLLVRGLAVRHLIIGDDFRFGRARAGDWQDTAERDRRGGRRAAPPLAQAPAGPADIVSDAVVPGAVQVPANGLPVVLLADGQTVGGYPKIATVIRADLPRLALMPAGRTLRFEAVDAPTARQALLATQADWQAWVASLVPHRPEGWLDEGALYHGNLVSGMLRAEP
ncbi:hypothetical protein [Sphaerotilus montanus]|uniref:hypothetical protein n=1 Tax=Sphaerotilus montanus TaxID=522889 RepID=UPI003FA1C80E